MKQPIRPTPPSVHHTVEHQAITTLSLLTLSPRALSTSAAQQPSGSPVEEPSCSTAASSMGAPDGLASPTLATPRHSLEGSAPWPSGGDSSDLEDVLLPQPTSTTPAAAAAEEPAASWQLNAYLKPGQAWYVQVSW